MSVTTRAATATMATRAIASVRKKCTSRPSVTRRPWNATRRITGSASSGRNGAPRILLTPARARLTRLARGARPSAQCAGHPRGRQGVSWRARRRRYGENAGMARLRYTAITSLDGYVNDSDGGFAWAEPSDELHLVVNSLEREVGTHLLGRRLYETMTFWETAPGDVPGPMGEYARIWRAADKVVHSTTLEDVTTARTRLVSSFDLAVAVLGPSVPRPAVPVLRRRVAWRVVDAVQDAGQHGPQQHEPDEDRAAGDPPLRPAEDEVDDEQHGTRHREREHAEAGHREPVARLDEQLSTALAKEHPVEGDRRDDQPGRDDRASEDSEVDVALEVGELDEAVGERHGQEEPGEDLHAGLGDPDLLEQLVPVAVERLLGRPPPFVVCHCAPLVVRREV